MRVLVSQADVDRMLVHAAVWRPWECCGVLIGRRQADTLRISKVIRASNIAEGDRRRRYQISWEALFEAYRTAARSGQEVLGFFHSHPDGADHPSRVDQAEALLNHLYIILPARSAHGQAHRPACPPFRSEACRAWWYGEDGFRESTLLNPTQEPGTNPACLCVARRQV